MRLRKTWLALCCLAMVGAVGFTSAARAEDAAKSGEAPVYATRGALTCMRCHDSPPVTDILKTAHAVKGDSRTPFGQHGCESCHGASPEHLDSHPAEGQKRTSPAVVYKGAAISPPEVRTKMCLSCHESGLRMNWKGSQHQSNDIACNDCHVIHTLKDPMKNRDMQPQKCFTCHADRRAESYLYSHHPIREGKVICSDCHNPHGSPGTKLLKEVRVNDTCYNCHPDKRGPYLWEHQPVREDCTICHNPHGSPNTRLLKEKLPFLCKDCHSGSNDMGGYGINSTITSPHGSFGSGADVGMARACTNCHSNIHGSNSPSGSSFFR
ncbi:MAG: DmsE family decaheme c-type cytochrome [Alphaproteobacteria bacterium]|nr:DmsE family decaheme c-type cytochrome [Alphaproteobacteria bacterium]